MLSNSKNENPNLKDLQITIKKYSSSKSIHLIDYFLIVGYEEIFIQEKIIKAIQSQDLSSSSSNNKYKCEEYPTVLSSINSDYEGEMMDDENIIKNIYPEPPNIIFNRGDNTGIDTKPKNIVFSKLEDNIINVGYAYTFYEFITLPNRINIFIPKTFVIISQYPYFITFNQICKEVYNLFHSNNVQIPIELQLYNIVNYIPIPIGKKLDITLFPFYELFEVCKCQCNEEFISLDNQKIYSLSQFKGYNKTQIDISEIFELIPVDVFIEVYLKLLSGHIISIFYNDIELLNIAIYIFKYLLFPLSTNNNVYSYSQSQYFNENNNIINNNELIYGFNTDYNNINKVKLNMNENKDNNNNNDGNIFESNYYLDLNKKSINMQSYDNLNDNKKKLNEFIKKVIEDSGNDTNDRSEISNDDSLEYNIKKLVKNINSIKEKIIRYGNNKDKYNFFELNNEKDLETNNELIIKAFYQFNLYISSQYYQKYLNVNNESTNNNDTEEEKIFYDLFSKSIYSKVLNDFKTNYLLNDHPDNMTKIIFENILLNKKINNNNNKLIESINNIDTIELFYKGKDNDKFEAVTFLDFYKYYFSNLQSYFYDSISNDFVDCTINKNDPSNIKILYKYKTINLDKNILLKYNYLLEPMPLEDKNKCFPYIDASLLSSLDTILKIKDINNTFEQFFINNKLISVPDIIRMAILCVVGLSTSGHKMIYFTEPIYDVIKKINVSVYKYIQIILSIAYRVFNKENNKNLFIYEKYFNLYDFVVDNNLIIANNDINIIHDCILKFMDSIKDKKNEEFEGNDYKSIKDVDNKKLYTIEPKLKEKEALKEIANVSFNGNVKNNKISFKTKLLKDKMFNINDVFSPLKVYNQLNKLVGDYYQNLEFNKINKDEYKKLIIHLIYYCGLYPQEFHKGIIKFLIYCLKTEH